MNEAKEWLKQNFPYLSDAEEQLAIKAYEAGMEKQKTLWHDCFLSCSSPYCHKFFNSVKMSGELGNMEKKENDL